MKDSSIQPAADGSGPALSTELTERLLQRATAPLGVIDVRQPQQHYARTAGWIAQRFALLDRWKTRYGSDEEASGAGASLVFAVPGQTLTEPNPAVPNVAQLARTVQQSVAAQASTVSPTSSSPPEQFRVRRHAMPSVSPPQATVTPSSPEATIRSKAERSDSHTGEIPAIMRQAAQTPTALILSKSPGGRVEDRSELGRSGNLASKTERSHHREGPSLPGAISTPPPSATLARSTISSHSRGQTQSIAAAQAQTPVSVDRVEPGPSSFPLRLQRKHSEALTGLAKGRELSEPSVSMATTQTTLSKSSLSQLHEPPLLPGGDDSARDVTSPVAERTVFTGSGASLAKVESSASFPLVQRQAVGSERTAETVHGDVAERRAAVATEIRSVPSSAPKPAMVWRQSAERPSSGGAFAAGITGGAGSALPLAMSAARGGDAQVARQATTAESTSSTNTEPTAPSAATPMPAAPPANKMDIAHLAEQVSRLLARQLAVERERRGRREWH
jgi:hypothetical protein